MEAREPNPACLNYDEHDVKNIMELPNHINTFKKVLIDLINLPKVDVGAHDEISAVLLRVHVCQQGSWL